eukprot:6488333-Amphidinium_carterae.1
MASSPPEKEFAKTTASLSLLQRFFAQHLPSPKVEEVLWMLHHDLRKFSHYPGNSVGGMM